MHADRMDARHVVAAAEPLGALGARLGGAPPLRPALRVLLGGAAAMAIAYLVGQAFNVSVA